MLIAIAYDPAKRARTLADRGLDFVWSARIFSGRHLTRRDDRIDYGEDRFVTAGRLDGHMIIVVWTPRGSARRIISMRKANERETHALAPYLD